MSMIIAPGVHPTWLVLLKGVIQPQWTSGFEASTFASLACAPPAAAPEKCEGWPGAAAPGQPSHFSGAAAGGAQAREAKVLASKPLVH